MRTVPPEFKEASSATKWLLPGRGCVADQPQQVGFKTLCATSSDEITSF